jgi:hypothetical protein
VEETRQYTAAEMERMMKVQEVLLQAMAKKITCGRQPRFCVTDRSDDAPVARAVGQRATRDWPIDAKAKRVVSGLR